MSQSDDLKHVDLLAPPRRMDSVHIISTHGVVYRSWYVLSGPSLFIGNDNGASIPRVGQVQTRDTSLLEIQLAKPLQQDLLCNNC